MAARMEVFPIARSVLARSYGNIVTGLLIAACVNIAPEGTFGAGVAEVGVLDLLKVCAWFWVLGHFYSGFYYLVRRLHDR